MEKIEIIFGDITKQSFDAIVNSANKSLLGGSGVDGAIFRAAGEGLVKECRELGGCPTGEAKITKSYGLAKNQVGWIIHAVGPRWIDGNKGEEELLKQAYRNSLQLCEDYSQAYLKQCTQVLERYTLNMPETYKEELRREVVEVAREYIVAHPIRRVAFPSISTGIYRFPLKEAVDIALEEMGSFLKENRELEKISIVCIDKNTFECYKKALAQ